MAKILTQAGLDALLRSPPSKRRETPDAKTKRLYFVDQRTGAASWAYRYSFNGLSKKLTLGSYPDIGLAKARALAANAAAALADGRSPAVEKQAAKTAAKAKAALEAAPLDLIDDVVAAFVEHAKKKTRLRSWRETERLLKREIIPAWGKRRLSTIARPEIYDRLDAIAARAPVVANRTLAHLKTMGAWAADRGIVAVNPFASIRAPSEETSRERVLDGREIAALLRAADAEFHPIGPFVRLLLSLAARRSEIALMRWSELDLVATKVWTLPKERSKNGREHKLPLPDAVVDILQALPRIEQSDLVLTLDGIRPSTACSTRAKDRMRRAMEDSLGGPVPNFTYHDLRRTAASGMAALGISPHVIEAVLNHKGGVVRGIAAVYNRHSYEPEQKSALEAWSRRLGEIEAGRMDETAENVVAFAKARG